MSDSPVCCRLDALSPAERRSRAALAARLSAALRSAEPLPAGYLLRIAPDAMGADELDALLALERRCCDFLVISRGRAGHDLVVGLTGPPGTREVLAAAFDLPA